jgi:hypothetical protein
MVRGIQIADEKLIGEAITPADALTLIKSHYESMMERQA